MPLCSCSTSTSFALAFVDEALHLTPPQELIGQLLEVAAGHCWRLLVVGTFAIRMSNAAYNGSSNISRTEKTAIANAGNVYNKWCAGIEITGQI